jgi:hypothetical protein
MKRHVPLSLKENRIRYGQWGSTDNAGMAGGFRLISPNGALMLVLSSGPKQDPAEWEHVSVSCEHRTPEWKEMCFVKDMFWAEDECVVQYHPPKSQYVNFHPYVLHLWKLASGAFPMPSMLLVGPTAGARS